LYLCAVQVVDGQDGAPLVLVADEREALALACLLQSPKRKVVELMRQKTTFK
jgi:hypothetical protein